MRHMEWWQRLDQRRHELGLSGADLSRKSGVPYASIAKYLKGTTDQPRGNVADRLAEAVGKTKLWLLEGIEPDEVGLSASARLVPVAIAGTVEAGTFREVDEYDQSEGSRIVLPIDDRFPKARQVAFEVSGDSMNDLRPRPIMPGDRLITVAYDDIDGEVALRDGMVVVVERTRDGGHTREWSVKQIELYEDRVEFHPRSTNPRHRPIVVNRDHSADDGTTVQIIGLVRRIVNDLPL